MMSKEQQPAKRGPGRPRRGQGSQHVDLTLSREVIAALEQVAANKSQFVDDWLRQHLDIARILDTPASQ